MSKEKNLYEKIKKIDVIFHLANSAGTVRYSITNPKVYIKNNINSFINILICKKSKCEKNYFMLLQVQYMEIQINFQLKKIINLILYQFMHLQKFIMKNMQNNIQNHYGLKTIGLRFFTVYGELGRPDMFLYKYLGSIKNKQKFNLKFQWKL